MHAYPKKLQITHILWCFTEDRPVGERGDESVFQEFFELFLAAAQDPIANYESSLVAQTALYFLLKIHQNTSEDQRRGPNDADKLVVLQLTIVIVGHTHDGARYTIDDLKIGPDPGKRLEEYKLEDLLLDEQRLLAKMKLEDVQKILVRISRI